MPGTSAATPLNVPPFTGHGWDLPQFTAEGQTVEEASTNPSLNLESIHPNYFETCGIPIVRGRAFREGDREDSVQVAVVSHDLAQRLWPGGHAVGKRLKMGGPDSGAPWYTIVGVAAQTRYREVIGPRPTLYLPAAQFQMSATSVALRTTAPVDQIMPLARDRIRRVDPRVQLVHVVPFSDLLEKPLARPRFTAFLLSVFGTTALLLSTVGLYAVMASYVRQRRTEIAVRLALGATAGRVRNLVIAEIAKVSAVGTAIGVAGTVLAGAALRSMLYEVHPMDPVALGGAALVLMAGSAVAGALPVRLATHANAAALLRGE
jgi:hypothetical protein